jgi:predicted nuclease with RNAse H fold
VKTLGIDLSADPAKTGACEIDWTAGAVSLLDRPTTDEQIVAAAQDAEMIAFDVPLGWPDAFVEAIVAHHDSTGWPPADTNPPADRVPLRYRTTDLVTRASGAQPLSVSSDLIGVAAMRGAWLQLLLVEAGVTVDRSGITGRVIEAYPAATLRSWGLASSKYKGRANAKACSALAAELIERCGHLGAVAAACLDGCDDDGLDAFICALVARAALAGLTTRPEPSQVDVARREGWIHVPVVGVAHLIQAARADA